MIVDDPFTTDPLPQAFSRLHKLARADDLPMLERITYETAVSLLSTAFAYRIRPNGKLLAEIANPNLTPTARAQDLNRETLRMLNENGIPIPQSVRIEDILSEDTTGGAEYAPNGPET